MDYVPENPTRKKNSKIRIILDRSLLEPHQSVLGVATIITANQDQAFSFHCRCQELSAGVKSKSIVESRTTGERFFSVEIWLIVEFLATFWWFSWQLGPFLL